MTTVVNFRDVKHLWDRNNQRWSSPDYVYIGRANKTYNLPESPWANPYRVENSTPRPQAIAEYKAYLINNGNLLLKLPELRGKTLICWCKPEACHGDLLAELANKSDTELADFCEWAGIASGQSFEAIAGVAVPTKPDDELKQLKLF